MSAAGAGHNEKALPMTGSAVHFIQQQRGLRQPVVELDNQVFAHRHGDFLAGGKL
jgi:site-specific recombinase XerC